jgi:hypothetical protein
LVRLRRGDLVEPPISPMGADKEVPKKHLRSSVASAVKVPVG